MKAKDNEKEKKETKRVVKKKPKKIVAVKEEPAKIITKELFTIKEVIWLVIITCFINLALFSVYINKNNETETEDNTYTDDNIKQIIETYNYIKDNYYKNIDEETLINGAIDGMTSSLNDNYSELISDSESDTYNIILEGEYYGIGIQIADMNGVGTVITAIIPESPASEANFEIGDVITKINGESTANMSSSDIGSLIKGGKGKTFVITVQRATQTIDVSVTTQKVILDSISKEIIEKNGKKVGYIYIDIFAANTDTQFIAAIDELEEEGIDSLIIDVRGNSGGHLSAVTNILSDILDSTHIIYQVSNRDGEVTVTYSDGKETKNYPIVVLGDSSSASASEILISALQESYGATFIGKQTYGKGSVQELQTIEATGAQYKITTQKWLTSNGNSIDGLGITPDIELELNGEYYNNPTNDTDNQLQRALEEITK
ncbi:MAG: S41 family peptidase [Bacilli bacterium]|nr:S41 family peptidase [Bacilli bacterium]